MGLDMVIYSFYNSMAPQRKTMDMMYVLGYKKKKGGDGGIGPVRESSSSKKSDPKH